VAVGIAEKPGTVMCTGTVRAPGSAGGGRKSEMRRSRELGEGRKSANFSTADGTTCECIGVKPRVLAMVKGMPTKVEGHIDPTVDGVAMACAAAGVRGGSVKTTSGLKLRGSVLGGVLRATGDV